MLVTAIKKNIFSVPIFVYYNFIKTSRKYFGLEIGTKENMVNSHMAN
jgi:hypothetical protein